jgi:hypothetical protein
MAGPLPRCPCCLTSLDSAFAWHQWGACCLIHCHPIYTFLLPSNAHRIQLHLLTMASDPLPKDVSIRSTLLHDDAIHGLFPDLPTAAAALERAVSPINKEDLNFLHAIP